jgi:predicted DNA-binding protein
MSKKVRRVGRPPKPEEQKKGQVAVRFPPELEARIERLIQLRSDEPSKSVVIREATALGMDILEARLAKAGRK